MVEKFIRNCPKCNSEMEYCNKYSLATAVEMNTDCSSGKCTGTRPFIFKEGEFYYKHCHLCNDKQYYSDRRTCALAVKRQKKCARCYNRLRKESGWIHPHRGVKKSPASIEKNRKSQIELYQKNPALRQVARVRALKRISEYGIRVGKKEKEWFDKINLKLEYQKILLEIGYVLDSYNEKLKIVIEYDEPKHEYPKKKEEDKIREINIINYLKPNLFLRFSEKNNLLYSVYVQADMAVKVKASINKFLKKLNFTI